MTRFEHDPQSGAFYIRIREGEYRETIPLAEPGFGAGVDVDVDGNVLGFEFLSFEEYAELLARSRGTLEIPEVIQGGESPLSREKRREAVPESLRTRLDTRIDAVVASLTPRQQAILRAHYYEGLGFDEVAEALGITKATLGRELGTALDALNRELAMGKDADSPQLEERLEEYYAVAG
jgi:RNA polymerase sigma factor (sigma-70 family)